MHEWLLMLGGACSAKCYRQRFVHLLREAMCRFSAAGMQVYRRAEAAGGRKAPRHEVAEGEHGGAAGAMGI